MTEEFDLRQNQDSGQLWLDDRKLLWKTIRDLKPIFCAETGTWRGGGSTFFIASALKMNADEGTFGGGHGVLYSVESHAVMFAASQGDYAHRWKHLAPYVRLNFGDSCKTYEKLLDGVSLDFLLLDGGEQVTAAEFDLLAPKVRIGGVCMVHDWFNGKRVEALAEAAARGEWSMTVIGTGTGSFESGSVGFAKAVRLR